MKLNLEILSGAMDGQEFSFHKPVTIGRDKANEVSLNLDKYVSRKHARLLIEDPSIFLEDLGSTNGSYIDGNRVYGRAQLENGQIFKIGRTWVQLSW